MDDREQKERAKKYAEKWLTPGAGMNEVGETETFWKELFRILGVSNDDLDNPEKFVREKKLSVREKEKEDGTKKRTRNSIDVFISLSESNRIFVEQKQRGFDLLEENENGETPFEQALRYYKWWDEGKPPRWIVTCNFLEFWIYDLESYKKTKRGEDPNLKIFLKDLPKKIHLLKFLAAGADESGHIKTPRDEEEISVKAGEIVGRLYDCIHSRFNNPNNPETLRALNILCVRLVFCLYAENAGIFPKYGLFHDYLEEFDAPKIRRAIIDLFKILNTPEEKRDPYLKDDNPILATFPYVNGGLFADESVEIPSFDDTSRKLLLDEASSGFNWHGISPTIFGAVFESTLNTETRRKGGMHYTSPVNIHKVIDPLFLDDLTTELEKIEQLQASSPLRAKKRALEFQDKLASLKFLDPACGSGNFLTETYLSLRELENRAIKLTIADGQTFIKDVASPIKVSISQFYGIEINDFAVSVAKTAMWIAESQMLEQTEDILGRQNAGDFLPLKRYANIAEGNALKMDWSRLEVESGDLWHVAQQAQEHTPKEAISYDYIFGNPPFVGYSLQSKEQKAEMLSIWCDEKGKPYSMAGKLDYVTGWFFKAASLTKGTNAHTAFVATNSISQGESVALWKPLFERFGIHIDFAYRTFRWDSESNDKAHVHCVVVGFSSAPNAKLRSIYDGEEKTIASNINGYLQDAPDVFVESRRKPLCKVPEMVYGNMPRDGGQLIIEAEEHDEFLKKEPNAAKFVKKFVGSEEFINGKPRWCLWLVDATPGELRAMPEVMKRVDAVREFRLASKKEGTRELAKLPTLFAEIRHPNSNYLVVPRVSSEKRRYVPMDFLTPDVICSDAVQIIPDATLFHFGVLISDVHMAWTRVVCGRLEMRYRYSGSVVYNNFPWASADEEQIQKISATAQGIRDARAKFPDSTLADLYDELTMPKELRDAHDANDKAVRKLFGFSQNATEAEIVRELFKRYSALANGN